MPLYEYECDACGHRFEKIQKFSDPLEDTCPKCGGSVHKLMSSPAIQFKGSGFYITDYARQSSDQGTSSDKAATEKSKDAKSDAAAADKGGGSETKTDTATKADAPAKTEPAAKPAAPSPVPSASGTKD